MPLWQSMQVSPFFMPSCMRSEASADCLWKSIASQVWQLRHSRESFASICAQTRLAMTARRASYFSGVEIVPTAL